MIHAQCHMMVVTMTMKLLTTTVIIVMEQEGSNQGQTSGSRPRVKSVEGFKT